MTYHERLKDVQIHSVDDNVENPQFVLMYVGFLVWLLCGMVGLKYVEKLQLTLNRLMGWVANPQDKDVHMFFFLSTLYVWLHFVSVSRLFAWLRSAISDGEADGMWTSYRNLIQQFGLDKFLRDSNATLLDESRYGQLYRKRLTEGEEPIMLLCVYDATVGESGIPSRYFLRVPPYMRTAKEAVAWTFGMSSRDYAPCIET